MMDFNGEEFRNFEEAFNISLDLTLHVTFPVKCWSAVKVSSSSINKFSFNCKKNHWIYTIKY